MILSLFLMLFAPTASASEVDLDWFTTKYECKAGMSQQECNQARANARRQAERDSASGREVVRDERDCRLVTVERTIGLNGPYPQIERRQERVCEGENPMVDGVPLSDVKRDPWLANGNAGMAYMAQAGMFQNGMMPMMGMYGAPMNAHSMSAMMANANSSARLAQEENASLRMELEANKRANVELARERNEAQEDARRAIELASK